MWGVGTLSLFCLQKGESASCREASGISRLATHHGGREQCGTTKPRLSPVTAVDLASAYYDVRQYDEAKAANERVLELKPAFAAAPFVSGQAPERQRNYAEAIARCLDAAKAVGLDPGIIAALGRASVVLRI